MQENDAYDCRGFTIRPYQTMPPFLLAWGKTIGYTHEATNPQSLSAEIALNIRKYSTLYHQIMQDNDAYNCRVFV